MSDVADFSLLNDDEKAELERVRLAVVEGERNASVRAEREERFIEAVDRITEAAERQRFDEEWAAQERQVNGEAPAPTPAGRRAKSEAPQFTAKPFVWRDPRIIKPRQWLHAKHYIRGFVSATVAPGGLGKSSLQLVEAVGMTAGRDLLKGTTARPLKVWYWNLEDPREEIDRRIAAIMLHYKIPPDEIEGRLFVTPAATRALSLPRHNAAPPLFTCRLRKP